MKKRSLIYLSLGGLVGPILFTLMTVICSLLHKDYNHLNQFISELGATGITNSTLMNYAGFIPSGLMAAAFGISLLLFLPKSVLSQVGAILISFFGLGVTLAGFFPCDAGCPIKDGSFQNVIHNNVSGPAFLSAIIGIFLLTFAFRRSVSWKSHWVYSLLSGLLAVVFMTLLSIYLESPTLKGLWQRLLLGTVFLWLAITAVRLFRSYRDKSH
jgi:Protein of unknown function (DUF998).